MYPVFQCPIFYLLWNDSIINGLYFKPTDKNWLKSNPNWAASSHQEEKSSVCSLPAFDLSSCFTHNDHLYYLTGWRFQQQALLWSGFMLHTREVSNSVEMFSPANRLWKLIIEGIGDPIPRYWFFMPTRLCDDRLKPTFLKQDLDINTTMSCGHDLFINHAKQRDLIFIYIYSQVRTSQCY